MPLPKMPGWEVVPPAPEPEPEKPLKYPPTSCQCSGCRSVPAADPVWISPEQLSPYSGTVTGRTRFASEAIVATYASLNLGFLAVEDQIEAPRWLQPRGASPASLGYPEGKYDFAVVSPNSCLNGETRWRKPGTMSVYDESGSRQWTYTQELPDGTLVDDQGRKWVPNQADVVHGRYTDSAANGTLSGEPRWLRRSTGTLYEDAACQHRANRSMQPLPDGTWRSTAGLVWEPL